MKESHHLLLRLSNSKNLAISLVTHPASGLVLRLVMLLFFGSELWYASNQDLTLCLDGWFQKT